MEAEDILRKAHEEAEAIKKEMTQKALSQAQKEEKEAQDECSRMMEEALRQAKEESLRLEAVLKDKGAQAVKAVLEELI